MSIFNCDDQKSLQTDLNNIQKWSSENKLKLNASKSVHLRFTKRKNLNIDNYVLNDEMIPIKSSHKHLGLIFDNNLSFCSQTEFIVNKCHKKWGFLKKLCKYANHEIFLRLYKTYLLPLLEYANLCWIPSNIEIAKIESVQRHITKFICYKKGSSNMSYKQRLENLNLESLRLRKKSNILLIVFKCIHNYTDVPNMWKNSF